MKRTVPPTSVSDGITTKQEDGKVDFYWNNQKYLGYAYIEVDGYYVFVFDDRNKGAWSGYALRYIADRIDELNKEWDEKVKQELS